MEPIKHDTLQPHPPREPVKPDVRRDPYAGFDLDPSRRPGYASRRGIEPWPNARWPVASQRREVRVFMHGRSNKSFPPVFGTDTPPHGLSGEVRRLAYAYPDHMARHWLLLLASDRVDLWETRARKLLKFALPALIAGTIVRRVMREA
jgi:hypothetical protein